MVRVIFARDGVSPSGGNISRIRLARVGAALALLVVSSACSGVSEFPSPVGGDLAGKLDILALDLSDPGSVDPGGPDLCPGCVDLARDPGFADEAGALDAGPDDIPGPGCAEAPLAFGCGCKVGSDCASGFCEDAPEGKVCTTSCVDTCPEPWVCTRVELGGPDSTFLCLHPFARLCRPCTANEDCAAPGVEGSAVICVAYGPLEGAFCGNPCKGDEDCPSGYQCASRQSVGGGSSFDVCVPSSGACGCAPHFLGAATPCHRGACSGERVCAAEGLGPCSAPEPEPEVCDGVDNDCVGGVDDPFKQGDLYVDDDHCGACDESCAGVVENGVARCGVEEGVARCLFERCDAGHERLGPDRCVPDREGQCKPCTVDADCSEGLACVPLGDGSFCLKTCDPADPGPASQSSKACAQGMTCAPRPEGQGHVCLSELGGCRLPELTCTKDTDCEDLDLCTTDACGVAGACLFSAESCDDAEPCTADTCDPTEGCLHDPVEEGSACEDGDLCNGLETCSKGVCAPGVPVDCAATDVCQKDGTCDPLTGLCVISLLPDGTVCEDDGDACNGVRHCSGGTCVEDVGPVTDCDDQNPCTADACDSATGQCGHTAVFDGTLCEDDGDLCNGVSHCSAGACVEDVAPVTDCDDQNPCTADACDSATGACTHSPASYSEPCYEGAPGTEGVGICVVGVRACQGSTLAPCAGQVLPAAQEDCSTVDDEDCDGTANQGCAPASVWWGFHSSVLPHGPPASGFYSVSLAVGGTGAWEPMKPAGAGFEVELGLYPILRMQTGD